MREIRKSVLARLGLAEIPAVMALLEKQQQLDLLMQLTENQR